MLITEAHWEKKNLGLNVLEIQFDNDFSFLLDKFLEEYDSIDYVVAKVNRGNLAPIHSLEDMGFRFLESQFELFHPLKKDWTIPFYLKKVNDQVSIIEETKDSVYKILEKMDTEMFNTDRVSLDPYLGKEKSLNRYKNWIIDELNRGNSILHSLIYKGERIGFFILKKTKDNTLDSLLAGLFSDYKKSGLGFCVMGKPVTWAVENGFKNIVTKVSSNNLESLRLHLAFGYEITSINYIFRKIMSGSV